MTKIEGRRRDKVFTAYIEADDSTNRSVIPSAEAHQEVLKRRIHEGEVNMANRITGVFAVVLAAVYLYATEQFPALEISDPLGPKVFPRLLGIGLLLTAGAMLVETLRAKNPETTGGRQKVSGEGRHYWVVAAAAIWTSLYLAVFEWLGYAISTSIYLLVVMAYFHRGKWTGNILTSVLYSFISYWMFTKLLGVSLPRGILPF